LTALLVKAQVLRLEVQKKLAKLVVVQVSRPSWWVDSICKPPAALAGAQEARYRLELDARLVTALEEFENKKQFKSIFRQV
jgi:hypothetical protein